MRDTEEDNYFAHQITGDIKLMMSVLGKLMVSQFRSRLDVSKTINELQSIQVSLNADHQQMNDIEIKFIAGCVQYYLEGEGGKADKVITSDIEAYGDDFSLAEIDDLIADREQRKYRLNEKLNKIMHKKGPSNGGMQH